MSDITAGLTILALSLSAAAAWAVYEIRSDRKYEEKFRQDWEQLRGFYSERKSDSEE